MAVNSWWQEIRRRAVDWRWAHCCGKVGGGRCADGDEKLGGGLLVGCGLTAPGTSEAGCSLKAGKSEAGCSLASGKRMAGGRLATVGKWLAGGKEAGEWPARCAKVVDKWRVGGLWAEPVAARHKVLQTAGG